ncbi:MAG TPA: PilW family protein [Xylella taiwanensis]
MNGRFALQRVQRGFNLIELMITLLLGLLVVLAAISMFISSRRLYTTTENMSRLQESARVAFELMARDLREAGGNACDNNLPVVNVLRDATTEWSRHWSVPLIGVDGGTLTGGLQGTDAIRILSAGTSGGTVVAHDPVAHRITLYRPVPDLHTNGIMMVCDPQQLSIFQASTVAGVNVDYGNAPLNTCTHFGRLPSVCNANPPNYQHQANSIITELRAVQWYVRTNGRGGTSLYQEILGSDGVVSAGEVAESISAMQMTYLLKGAAKYVTASEVSEWKNVIAVRVALTIQTTDRVGVDNRVVARTLTSVISLRNRNL